ncbi:MAG: lipid-A-disaccharide synthase [Bacteroidetes bacterium]|nr:lipid-A-disaccharide synthase [Bacteroidota bacterium]
MKFYIIAGEASGDLHGSNLIKALKHKFPTANFRSWGGDLMQEQGATIVKHYRELAFMGFAEVLFNIRTILNNLSFCKEDIAAYQPDCVIFIDYPGFNMRIAEFVHDQGIKSIYYIAPQVWAWKKSRVHKLKRTIDKMLVILPFEKAFYAKYNVEACFVGHPLLDAVQQYRSQQKSSLQVDKPVIALLPGSRKQEINAMLPLMLRMPAEFPDYKFVLAAAPSIDDSFYASIINNASVEIVRNKTYDVLNIAHAAIVASGTATLETALFRVPQVVCYKGNWVSIQIAKRLVDIKYISLVNLIADKKIVTELIQEDFNFERLRSETEKIIAGNGRQQMIADYDQLITLLGNSGASDKAATEIANFMI